MYAVFFYRGHVQLLGGRQYDVLAGSVIPLRVAVVDSVEEVLGRDRVIAVRPLTGLGNLPRVTAEFLGRPGVVNLRPVTS